MYDIVIIGSGPAGATLARLLNENFNIAVIDKKNVNENSFKKPCGGLLALDAQKALARFNLTLPNDILVNPQIFSVRTIDIGAKLTTHYQRFYLNIDRHKFDLWLISLIPSNVKVFDNSQCNSIVKTENGYKVSFYKDNELINIEAKYIIGADGANSIVRNSFFKEKKIRQYISIQQWFKDEHIVPFYSSIFDESITDCYAWSVSKDGYIILGGAFPLKNSKENFEKLKVKLVEFGFLFKDLAKTEACLVLRPKSFFDFCLSKNDVFLVGEAAGFISPSSLEGISYALNSAYALSKAFNVQPLNPQKHYKRNTLKLRIKLIMKNLKSPFMYVPFLRRMIMRSKYNTISIEK